MSVPVRRCITRSAASQKKSAIAPTASSPGTGFTPFDAQGNKTSDYGLELTLKIGSAQSSISSGWFLALDLLKADGTISHGANDYSNNIAGCSGQTYKIGDTLSVSSEQGNMVGPTQQGVNALTANDPNAVWNTSTQSITGSCARWSARSPAASAS